MMNKSIAICAATPFQTLNAINLACNHLDESLHTVLFYRNYSKTTDAILQKIREYNLFDEVNEYDLVSKTKGLYYYLNDFQQATMPKKFIEDRVVQYIHVSDYNFDYITITSGTELEVALTRVFPNAKTVAYDDGLGSYVGDIVHDHKLHWMWRALGRRTDQIWPVTMFVNNSSFCESKLSESIQQLKPLTDCDDQYQEMINDIFSYSQDNPYTNKKIIYLTQPLEEVDKSLSLQVRETERKLDAFSDNCVVRMHPRVKQPGNTSILIDSTNNFWELICANDITDEHILVGVCSSAQVMPKILFDKEPWIFFTFNQYRFLDESVIEKRFLPIANNLRSSYTHKEKVILTTNDEELEQSINKALRHNNGVY